MDRRKIKIESENKKVENEQPVVNEQETTTVKNDVDENNTNEINKESTEPKETNVSTEEKAVSKSSEQNSKPKAKKLDARTISTLLKNKTFEESIELGKSFPELKDLAESINRFMEHTNSVSPDEYIRHSYSIYNAIKNVINDPDYNRFSTRFRYLINVICKANKEKKVNELTFLKYDYKWQWGGAEYSRYSKLVTVIFTACERGIKEVQKVYNIDKLTSLFTETGKNNLKKFF